MNYNSFYNKPTLNHKELIGDNKASDIGGITEEEFNTLMSTDLASYYTKAQIDELFARSFVFRDKSGGIVTFDCPESTNGIFQLLSDIVAVQSGSGDPSSTNIRPFTGWSAVNVYDTGINVWDEEWEVGGLNPLNGETTSENDRIRSKNFRPCKPNKTMFYYIPSGKGNLQIVFYDINKNYLGYYNFTTEHTFTTPNGCYFFKFNTGGSYGTTYNNDISINYPSTDTEYHAYNGQTYTTALKDGQGNPLVCYGGGLMNAGGSQALVVTKGHIASYNGETLPSTWISDRDVYAEGTTPSIGAEVVYELETPLQIPQDSLSIVSTGGINNIWCDSGDITVRALDKIIQE